jgi:hypothetical protein
MLWSHQSGHRKPSGISPGVEEFAVAFKRAQVLPIGSEADVAVGAHHEECGALDAEEIGADGLEPSDAVARLWLGAEGDGRFEQRRVGGEFLQSGLKLHERRTVGGWATQEQEGVASAVGKLVKATGLPVRALDLDRVG